MQIGNLQLSNDLVMAPMAGYTNLPFRLMVKKLGAGLVTTEMVSAMGLLMGQRKTLGYLRSDGSERPVAVQIFGSKPEVMARAAQIAAEEGADLVDINMGCPVKKVVKTGAGAALLREPERVGRIVRAVRLASPLPLTVKIRAGWSPREPVACEIARIAEDSGADAVTVHGRFATEGYSKPAEWSWIARVKERVGIPVIGNGDVFDPQSALEMKRLTGCDGVMIGRGALGNPWLFKQILHLEQGLPCSPPGLSERRSMIVDHFSFLSQSMGEGRAALAMRGLLLLYTKGLRDSSRFRERVTKVRDAASLATEIDHYFSSMETGNP